MRELTCTPGTEIFGQNINAWVDNLQSEETAPVMAKYGLIDLDPAQWYPLERLLSAMNDLARQPNLSPNLVAIGMSVAAMVPMPPEMPNPEVGTVLMAWDAIYQSLHRCGDVGKISCEKLTDKHYKITFTDLYPDDFSYGIIFGYARRFLPEGTEFTVFYDPEVPARDYGGKDITVTHLAIT